MATIQPPRRALSSKLIPVATGVLVLLAIGFVSHYALLTFVIEGLTACLVLGPAWGLGLALVPLFRLGPMPIRWHLLLGAALGIGGTSLLVLMLGLLGLLQRPIWITLLIVFAVIGSFRLRKLLAEWRGTRSPGVAAGAEDSHLGPLRYLAFALLPFFVLAVLAATTTPGLIWKEEGFGYDVLEYHLQLPKEYFENGSIQYAPHNVYANFPANVEMLYLLAMIVVDDSADSTVTANFIHLFLGVLTVFAAWVAGREWSPRTGIASAVIMGSSGWLIYFSGLAYVENGLLFFGMVSLAIICHSGWHEPLTGWHGQLAARGKLLLSGLCAGLACGCKYTALPMLVAPMALAILCGVVPLTSKRRNVETSKPIRNPRWQAGWPAAIRNNNRTLTFAMFLGGTLLAFSPWLIKNQIMTGNPVFPLLNRWIQASPPGWGPEQTEQWEKGHRLHIEQGFLFDRASALWNHVLWDKHQRFGPMIFMLAVLGCRHINRKTSDEATKRRSDEAETSKRQTLDAKRQGQAVETSKPIRNPQSAIRNLEFFLVLMFLVQLAVWLFGTHGYARFAVPFLIPLSLLAGCSLESAHESGIAGVRRVRWTLGCVVILLIGVLWNFTFAARLAWEELPLGIPPEAMTAGQVPGYEYLGVVNQELPPDAKILLLGEARPFYLKRNVDYCVVFNRNPFVDIVRSAPSEQDIVQWLHQQDYTHVFVNWSEVRRLSRTYGFAAEIQPELFARLEPAGLRPLRFFSHPEHQVPYGALYELLK